jgi:hypothetical protein
LPSAYFQVALLLVQVQDYQGGRTASDIVSHAQQLLEVHGGPPTQIEELLSNEMFDEKCVQRTGICILAFLPHLLDENAAQRSKRLSTLTAVASAKDIKKLPVRFLWMVSIFKNQSSFSPSDVCWLHRSAVISCCWSKRWVSALGTRLSLLSVAANDVSRSSVTLLAMQTLPSL